MRQLLQDSSNGRFSVARVPKPVLRPTGILVRTAFSLVSPGTEKTSVSTAKANLLGKARRRPDL
ncbi:hypothetical protein MJD09_13180, partial [bacterium]|nr:hypothetical protein [bacterium]